MSAFQITITPRTKQRKRMEGREPAEVVMAPFSAKSIVQFEDVPITKTARRLLRIINPSEEPIEVKVSKAIKEEHNLTMEWIKHIVPALDEVSMELVWNPQVEIACKETIQLLDNRNFRKDIMVILKSIHIQPAKNQRKFPTVGKTLQLKSPTGNSAKIGKVASTAAGQPKKRLSVNGTAAASAKPQWRASCSSSRPRLTPTPASASAPESAPLCEMNSLKPMEGACYISPKSQQGDSKENVSPMTPAHVLNMIDKLKFTPLADSHDPGAIARIMPDNLAAWPTPILQAQEQMSISINEMRPRRLANLLEQDDQPINNKTFDVKNLETMNLSLDPADSSQSELLQLQTPTRAMMNKTTTIVHATQQRVLECIREEETSPAKSRPMDLKRDIKLVGSPLRKYSESMKDLSLVSSQSKLAIQGSMPNLNEMQQIRSIEQNRYYQEQQLQLVQQQQQRGKKLQQELNASSSSEASFVSGQPDFQFNHNEILAQSSRVNIHEIGRTSKANPQKRRSGELTFSDSRESLHGGTTHEVVITPPKKLRVEERIRNAITPANASAISPKSWIATQAKTSKLARTCSLMKKPQLQRQMVKSPIKLYDSELHMQTYINPDPFAATTTSDPFMASTMYLDEKVVERHEIDFKKWLNALVSVPADLDGDTNSKIDVGKLFNEVRNKELVVAPTKEQQSVTYLTTFRLEKLRRAAVELFFSKEMCQPCSQVAVYIGKRSLRIRSDRNLHLDVVMQRTILELLLCFNPVWLRLGLEVVFGEKIQMQSSRDMVSLSSFILNRLFRNKLEERKYSKAYTLTEEYAENIKRHTLQKTLFLFLFLDQAKEKRIVAHNPCLFVKKSPHKETKDVLLRFASELLANIGDITRELRRLGYVLQHKQTYLDEFNYAFTNIAVDLRDGVRLTRVMEIILLRDDLTRQLRVPAISRLQRVYNVKLALEALRSADFMLGGDISPADIVDGYREKTLSLLWQIIYKFRSPKFHAAASVIQLWWRRRSLHVAIQRRIREKELRRRNLAAVRIQAAFRGHQARKYIKIYKEERIKATIVLQKFTRRYLAQKELYLKYRSIVRIQSWWRAHRLGREQRKRFLEQRQAAIFIQRIWRRRLFANKLLETAATLRQQQSQKVQAAATHIQMFWRNYRIGQLQRQSYLRQRELIIRVQQRVRANWLMRKQRLEFSELRQCVISLQQRGRANLLMRQERSHYQLVRTSVVKVQQYWRGNLLTRSLRKVFLVTRSSVICIQEHWRATLEMRKQREQYLQLRAAAVAIQQRWRARQLMLQKREEFLKLRTVTINMQRRFRATKAMRFLRAKYRGTQAAVSCLQMHWRGHLQRQRDRNHFLALRKAAITVQRRYRARLAMLREQKSYELLRHTVITIQRRYRAKLEMKQQVCIYQRQRELILFIQQRFRAIFEMRKQRFIYQSQKQAVVRLQGWWRGLLEKRKLQSATLTVQRKWRAILEGRRQRAIYIQTLTKIRFLQSHLKATLLMRRQRLEYQQQRQAATTLQHRFRARQLMIKERSAYLQLKHRAILVQCKFRATRWMRQERQEFVQLRIVVIHLQQKFRGNRLMLKQRQHFLQLRSSTLNFQARVRGYLARQRFQALKTPQMMELMRQKQAARTIQRHWRGFLARRKHGKKLQEIRKRLKKLRCESLVTNSVRCRVKEAVSFLRGRYNASDALAVLARLDNLSRHVPHLLMWCAEFMATFCYGIMAQAIRSEVDKLIIERCSRIILNLARYNSTTVNTFQEGGLVTVAQMLLRWCDKDCEIFNTLCTLIWVFAHCPRKRRIIYDYMNNTDAIYMIRETKKLVARKEKMKENARKYQPQTATFGHQQNRQARAFPPSALPSREPDFGLIRSNPYIFQSSVFAFDTILIKLGIDLG